MHMNYFTNKLNIDAIGHLLECLMCNDKSKIDIGCNLYLTKIEERIWGHFKIINMKTLSLLNG